MVARLLKHGSWIRELGTKYRAVVLLSRARALSLPLAVVSAHGVALIWR